MIYVLYYINEDMVKDYITSKNMSYKDFSIEANIPETLVKKIIEDKQSISLHYLIGIARVLGVYWSQLVLDVDYPDTVHQK